MATTTIDSTEIIGSVDTHQDLHTAAVVSLDGAVLGTESFSTTRAGYRASQTVRWNRYGCCAGSGLMESCFASVSSPPEATEPASLATWRCRACRCSR